MSLSSLYLKGSRLLAVRVSFGREFQSRITDRRNEFNKVA